MNRESGPVLPVGQQNPVCALRLVEPDPCLVGALRLVTCEVGAALDAVIDASLVAVAVVLDTVLDISYEEVGTK